MASHPRCGPTRWSEDGTGLRPLGLRPETFHRSDAGGPERQPRYGRSAPARLRDEPLADLAAGRNLGTGLLDIAAAALSLRRAGWTFPRGLLLGSRIFGPRACEREKPGFPRLSGQWSPPVYGGAGLKMCVLAQF